MPDVRFQPSENGRTRTLKASWAWVLLLGLLPACFASGNESKIRKLYSFEAGGEAEALSADSENVQIIPVLDNGVTEGKQCGRVVVKKGQKWAYFTLARDKIKNWSGFDYFAMDLYTADTSQFSVNFELWDKGTKNYQTRCTTGAKTRPGQQTILFKINRAKRNGKEGRSWAEAQPADKIKMDGLTKVKFFFSGFKDRDLMFWIDNLRLVTEDIAHPKFEVPVPKGALAFDFSSASGGSKGCSFVTPTNRFTGKEAYGFLPNNKLTAKTGKGWPDALTGSYIMGPEGAPIRFTAKVPNGAYRMWLVAGPIYRSRPTSFQYVLKANGQAITEETVPQKDYFGEKHYYRFLRTQFSRKPGALWKNYVSRMYPAISRSIEVTEGKVEIEAVNHFISALVLVPAANEAAFKKMEQDLEQKRIAAFEKENFFPKHEYPKTGKGDCTVFIPPFTEKVYPWTRPAKASEIPTTISTHAAIGQTATLRFAVTPWKDLGRGSLSLGALNGPGKIGTGNMRAYFANYRFDGKSMEEGALLPAPGLIMEDGITLAGYVRVNVPKEAKPGTYKGVFTFNSEQGQPVKIPVSLQVYPFRLEEKLPAALGMYYGAKSVNGQKGEAYRAQIREQLQWMREIGFTSVSIGAPRVKAVNLAKKAVSLAFDSFLFDLIKEVGMGAHPEQAIMAPTLSIGRAIGRKLPGSKGAKVDQNPGIELRQPGFHELAVDAYKKYKAYIDSTGVPVAAEVVDEPREHPNPWNRNLKDTIAYAKMLKEAGLRRFITPMGDSNNGVDYTPLVDNTDIISVHAWNKSARMIDKAAETGTDLWIYNTGKDRYSWGFYNWRMNSKGRWEWHFRWTTGTARGEYPGQEWHNPFTKTQALSTPAPSEKKYPGSMVFRSDYFNIAEGITDLAYIYTLENCIKKNKDAKSSEPAQKFLADLRKALPKFANVKGMADGASGALVGKGLEGDAKNHVNKWREEIAGHIIALSEGKI